MPSDTCLPTQVQHGGKKANGDSVGDSADSDGSSERRKGHSDGALSASVGLSDSDAVLQSLGVQRPKRGKDVPPEHGFSARAADDDLNGYFAQQAASIQEADALQRPIRV